VLRHLGSTAYLALALLLAAGNSCAHAQEVVHGADSLFVAPTVKIAWAIQKGATEETTFVFMRIVNTAGRYRQVRLDGVDPFSKTRKVLAAVRPLAASIDLSVPRSGFAEFPSCEIHLYARDAAPTDEAPSLTVYYLGVPDTTPEFASAQQAQAYLLNVVGK
jgi:hypothetical protein